MVPAISTGRAVALLACALILFALQMYLFWVRLNVANLANAKQKQNFAGAAMLVMLGVLGMLCYRFNYWPGITPRYRSAAPQPVREVKFRRPAQPVSAIALIVLASAAITSCGITVRIAFKNVLRKLSEPMNIGFLIRMAGVVFVLSIVLTSAIGGFVIWLSRLTTVSVDQIFRDPPSVIVAAIFGWFILFFGGGIAIGHTFAGRLVVRR